MKRPSGRAADQLRPIRITRRYTKHAEGSVLVEFGDTQVICTVSVESGVPRFLKGQGHEIAQKIADRFEKEGFNAPRALPAFAAASASREA